MKVKCNSIRKMLTRSQIPARAQRAAQKAAGCVRAKFEKSYSSHTHTSVNQLKLCLASFAENEAHWCPSNFGKLIESESPKYKKKLT